MAQDDYSGLDIAQAYQILKQAADQRPWMTYANQGPIGPAVANTPQTPLPQINWLGHIARRLFPEAFRTSQDVQQLLSSVPAQAPSTLNALLPEATRSPAEARQLASMFAQPEPPSDTRMHYVPQGPMLPQLQALAVRPPTADLTAPEQAPGLLPYTQRRVPSMSPEDQQDALQSIANWGMRDVPKALAAFAAGEALGVPMPATDVVAMSAPGPLQDLAGFAQFGHAAAGRGVGTPWWKAALDREMPWQRSPEQSQLSTRVPTNVDAPEDAFNQMLTTGYESWKSQPEPMRKNVEAMLEYPNFRDLRGAYRRGKLTLDETADEITNRIKDNLLWLHDQMHPDFRDRARLWYDGAHIIANRWANEYGATPQQVAGAMAVTSPLSDWFVNAERARRLLEFWQNRDSMQWTPEMAAKWKEKISGSIPEEQRASTYNDIRGKSFNEVANDPHLRAVWFRLYDAAHNPSEYRVLTPEGEHGDIARNKPAKEGQLGEPSEFNWAFYNHIEKALNILQDGSMESIHDNLGLNHKVRNFYNNIVFPNSPLEHTTIDTHAVAAGLLRPLSGKNSIEVDHNFGGKGSSGSGETGEQGTYSLYKEAYRRAAEERDLLPRELQSITWEALRSLFTPQFKGQRANVDAVNQLWNDVAAGKMSIDEARKNALRLGGGFTRPAWHTTGGWDNGLPPEEGIPNNPR